MSDDQDLIRICNTADLLPGDKTLVDVQGTMVCVRNVEGDFYAIQNECPHQGGPLCQGRVAPELVGEFNEPGERVNERMGDKQVVACPWHGWEYDLETGNHVGANDISVKTYDVIVDGDGLYVEKSASSPEDQ